METKSIEPLSETELLSRLLALLGPPPILTPKKGGLRGNLPLVAQCVKPQNMLDVIGPVAFCVCRLAIKRYGRHATVAIERVAQQALTFHAERARLRKSASRARTKEMEKLTQAPADIARSCAWRTTSTRWWRTRTKSWSVATWNAITTRSLLALLDSQEQLNRLIISQTAIKNDCIGKSNTSGPSSVN